MYTYPLLLGFYLGLTVRPRWPVLARLLGHQVPWQNLKPWPWNYFKPGPGAGELRNVRAVTVRTPLSDDYIQELNPFYRRFEEQMLFLVDQADSPTAPTAVRQPALSRA